MPKEKISKIKSKVQSHNDKLKEIKEKLNDNSITYDEINCVLANHPINKYKKK